MDIALIGFAFLGVTAVAFVLFLFIVGYVTDYECNPVKRYKRYNRR
jgi:hypothetical protein